ncbi:hypothetical protein GCM10011508_17350 [Flavobacterium lutivivi]|nr:hypothetical protein GCM10011508_17350 [Flavobacterium lutivivi]
MTKKDDFIFKGLNVIAWVIFVGLCIEAGALVVNFVYSIFKPEIIHNLYQKLDLSDMYHRSQLAYYGVYSFILVISIMKAYLFYIVINLLLKLDLKSPFNHFVSEQIMRISQYTFYIGILSYIAKETVKNLQHHGFNIDGVNKFWGDSQAFILMAAIIYIIALIFKKGIEIQQENDLTI